MALQLKKEEIFTGIIREHFAEFICNYGESTVEYDVESEQKLYYINNVLDREAITFLGGMFRINVLPLGRLVQKWRMSSELCRDSTKSGNIYRVSY